MKHVILISGLPCTGKSRLAGYLAAELEGVLFSKDDLKEHLFLHAPHAYLSSREAGIAMEEVLWLLARRALRGADLVLLESTFLEKNAQEQVRELREENPTLRTTNIWCTLDEDLRRERITERLPGRSRVHRERSGAPLETPKEAAMRSAKMRLDCCDRVIEYHPDNDSSLADCYKKIHPA